MKRMFVPLFVALSLQLFSQSAQMLENFRTVGAQLGNPKPESPVPQRCAAPQDYGWWQAFDQGWLYSIPASGGTVVQINTPIFSKWSELGKEQGALGFPIFSMSRLVENYQSIDRLIFEGGTISHNYVTGQTTVTYNNKQVVSGRYRLILCGFKVERQTADDPLQRDGKGDEIFIRTDAFLIDAYSNVTRPASCQTKLMGDINGFPERLRVGSLGETGGLATGDLYPLARPWQYTSLPASSPFGQSNLPMKIWEGEITKGNYLVVMPSVWEWDENTPSYFQNNWNNFLTVASTGLPRSIPDLSLGYSQFIARDKATGNLPIGLWESGYNNQTIISLPTPAFVASRRGVNFSARYDFSNPGANPSTHGEGVFEAVFQSTIAPSGSYRLYLKWEKLSVKTNPSNYSNIIK
jgi:hypothetical protein